MIAIENNQEKVVLLLLLKEFTYPNNNKLLEEQKNSTDAFGNNPIHKACRFRNPRMIKMLFDKRIGDIFQRNSFGKLPHEMPHNDILNDPAIKNVFENYIKEHQEEFLANKVTIPLNKEPDYIFIVNRSR